MSRKKPHGSKPGHTTGKSSNLKPSKRSPDELMRFLANEMEHQPTAEALNDNVLIPFMAALEKISEARGYVLNVYGEKSNLVFTSEEHAEQIYYLIEQYLEGNAEPE